MLQRSSRGLLPALNRHFSFVRSYSSAKEHTVTTTADNPQPANDPNPEKTQKNFAVSSTNRLPSSSFGSHDGALQESPEEGEAKRVMQAPNREGTWSRSQQARSKAMVGPRFEQTIMEEQPRPLAAIDLIHKQPVRWTKERQVSCDGGGGPLGHPRIFINVDKPQVCWCTYCGLPFANEHHRPYLESLPSTPYPLEPGADAAQLPEGDIGGSRTGSSEPYQSSSGRPYEQR